MNIQPLKTFSPISGPTCPPVNDSTIHSLGLKAAGHFQWAATACRFVTGKESFQEYGWPGGMSKQKQLKLILGSSNTYGLDGLYTTIITESFQDFAHDQDFLRRFQSVLGRVLLPPTIVALAKLKGVDEEESDTFQFLHPLSSLLQGVSGKADIPVWPLHTSL